MPVTDTIDRTRTSADIVFEALRDQIVSLEVLPGTKLSEAEIAKRFGLSRQPIRDAFSRLANMGLIQVRPQRPTVVRRLSLTGLQHARFVRASVEIEVLRLACQDRDTSQDNALTTNLASQSAAAKANDPEAFHRLDYDFHHLLCRAARADFAFGTIAAKKSETDRLCVLSLTDQATMEALLGDHIELLTGVRSGNFAMVEQVIRRHLDRLTPTIDHISRTHHSFFEG